MNLEKVVEITKELFERLKANGVPRPFGQYDFGTRNGLYEVERDLVIALAPALSECGVPAQAMWCTAVIQPRLYPHEEPPSGYEVAFLRINGKDLGLLGQTGIEEILGHFERELCPADYHFVGLLENSVEPIPHQVMSGKSALASWLTPWLKEVIAEKQAQDLDQATSPKPYHKPSCRI